MSRDEKKTKRQRAWLFAAIVQLCLMTAGAAQIPFQDLPGGFILSTYADLSGASHAYGFFSPGVYSQLRAVVDVFDEKGDRHPGSLRAGSNREVDLRVNDIFDQFVNEFDDRLKFQRILAASLAGSVLASDRRAKKVEVRLEQFTAPSRVDFLKGAVANWKKIYSVQLVHKAKSEKK